VRGPSFAKTDVIINDSFDADNISVSAFALADFNSLSSCDAVGDGIKLNMLMASVTVLPLIKSIKGFTFLTDTPVFLIFATAGIAFIL
jgi:hypothetical protein